MYESSKAQYHYATCIYHILMVSLTAWFNISGEFRGGCSRHKPPLPPPKKKKKKKNIDSFVLSHCVSDCLKLKRDFAAPECSRRAN